MCTSKSGFLLFFFQICGFCHFTNFVRFPTKKSTRFLFIWSCFHLFALSSLVLFAIHYAKYIFMLREIITAFTDILQWTLPVLSQYIIIIESLCTVKIQYRFWTRIRYMDQFLLNTSAQLQDKSINSILIKCVALLASTTAVDLFILFRVKNDKTWRNDLLTSFYTLTICRSQILFYTFFIDTLKYRVQMIILRLKEMKYRLKNKTNLLRCCKKSFEIIWKSVEDINRAFGMSNFFEKLLFFPQFKKISCFFFSTFLGWSLLATVISYFICTSIELYWAFESTFFRSGPYIFESFLGIYSYTLCVFVIFYSVEEFHFTVRLSKIRTKFEIRSHF